MDTLPASKMRDELSDILSRVAFGKERIVLERYGKELAALIPISDLRRLESFDVHENE